MYDKLISLQYSDFEKELTKIYNENLQPKEKIIWETKIMASTGKVIGVTSETLNNLKKIAVKRPNAWEEIEKLWKKDSYEERALAHEILRKAEKSDREKLDLIFKLIPTCSGWGDTDGFVTHELGKVIRRNPETAFDYAEKHYKSKNKWERRFSMVILVQLTTVEKPNYVPRVLKLAEKMLQEEDPIVQKAVSWAIKQGHKHAQDLIFEFLKKHAKTIDKNQIKIIRHALEYQTSKRKQELRNMMT